MALIDELNIHIKAGRGGDGVVRWIHEKFKEFGGPGGGDGGRGGSVYAKAVRDSWLLAKYRHTKEFSAEDGQQGGNHLMKGKDGEDLTIDVPVGTIIRNVATGDEFRLDEPDQVIQILKGGNGGLGNDRFKSSTNQQPKQSTPGKPGEEADFYIEVQLIADAGFIGIPNAGKSSLLNALTHANVKVGSYQFTTLEPNLGDLYGRILADIPGLIEGASEGRGLGHKFLRHIKRTKLLIHCITCEHFANGGIDEVAEIYSTIRKELQNFDQELADKKEIVLFTKTDTVTKEQLLDLENKIDELSVQSDGTDIGDAKAALSQKYKNKETLFVTILDDDSVKVFSSHLLNVIG